MIKKKNIKSKAVIILNGLIHDSKKVKLLCRKRYTIAADGGANFLRKANVFPDIIIGDLDSIKTENIKYFRNSRIPIIRLKEQETTDFEKSLKYAIKNGYKDIIIFGAISESIDHTLNNLSVIKRYTDKIKIRIYNSEFEIFYIKKYIKFKCPKNTIISLMPMPFAKGITTRGLKYRLRNEDLEFGKREGTRNISYGNEIGIRFKSGYLLLFKPIS